MLSIDFLFFELIFEELSDQLDEYFTRQISILNVLLGVGPSFA